MKGTQYWFHKTMVIEPKLLLNVAAIQCSFHIKCRNTQKSIHLPLWVLYGAPPMGTLNTVSQDP